MRARHDGIGGEIRRSRRAGGHTQESLAYELGVDRTTVGKWERGTAWPSAKNLRGLVDHGLVEASTLRRVSDTHTGCPVLTAALTERVATTFGCEISELRARTPPLRDDAEAVLICLFRMLSAEQHKALLEIISSMTTAVLPMRRRE